MRIVLGNVSPVEVRVAEDGSRERETLHVPVNKDGTETTYEFPGDPGLGEIVVVIEQSFGGAGGYHSDDPPAWVACENTSLQNALAEALNCASGQPDDWESIQ